MLESYLVPMATGLALGFGLASVAYLSVFSRLMRQAHDDAVAAAALLLAHQQEGVQKVIEQNGGGHG